MTKTDAIKSMKEGHKVTHSLFTSDEFIWMDREGKLRDENRYNISSEFWMWRTGDAWEKDWSLFTE